MRTKRVSSWLLIAAIAAVTWVVGGGTAQAQTKNQKGTKGTPHVKVSPDGKRPWAASSAAESAHSKVKRGDDSGGRVGGPPNDDCADAFAITEGDTPFSNVGAVRDGPDLPPECEEGNGFILGMDIWYDYTPSACGIVTVSTCDSDYDVRIAAYEDCDCPVTNERLVGCDDDSCDFAGPAQMEFPANAGTCYKLRIGGWGIESSGSGQINIAVQDAGLCCGAEGNCCSNNGTPGCEDLYCCSTVCAADPDCCDVSWDAGCAAAAADVCSVCTGGPDNDHCADAIAVSEGEFAYSNVGASMDGPDLPPECDEGVGVVLGSDLWYDYTPSVTGVATVTTCDLIDYDARIAAYSGCDCPVTDDRVGACDDDGCGDPPAESVMEFPVVAGKCYKLRIGGFGTSEQGSGSILISAEAREAPNPLSSDPPDCAIDGRQPSDLEFDCSEVFGWDALDIAFDGDVSGVLAAHFTVTVDPPDVTPPNIVNIVPGGNTATLELDGRIPPGHWTTFTYAPSDPDWSTQIGYLPADVTGDGTSGPLDILALIDFLNEVGPALDIWQTDVDRSGESNSADILSVIDLLNGAGCFDSWNGQTLPGDCP